MSKMADFYARVEQLAGLDPASDDDARFDLIGEALDNVMRQGGCTMEVPVAVAAEVLRIQIAALRARLVGLIGSPMEASR